ncbi:MAG TPA: S8 family serine peptidase [Gaiellaceae bacterium]|nr:S8 family serine peptidase [Gaiellaceae bacterium]
MIRRGLAVVAAAAAFLALPGIASAARVAIGLERGADADRVAEAVQRRTGTAVEQLAPIPALVVEVPESVSLAGLRRISGVRYVERLGVRRLSLTPTDPMVSKQWYLTHSRFYESWLTLPALESVAVAVLDSGVDDKHPELAGKILQAKSFVGGSPRDSLGHGTFVAGLIAATVDNGIGIAGLAPSAELLVAKVVTPGRAIPIEAEARAIRWAVDQGAQVINMSLGGVRNPLDPSRDTYSRLEADAVAYAVSNGVVVVAAVGNGDQAPSRPWSYASYPAALPHVLGVSALTAAGAVPRFSNRDRIFNDIAAPGDQILSIFPRPMTGRYPACSEQGYSSCGPEEYRSAQGTSFAAPQVAAAAAVLLSLRPTLAAEQVTTILQRTAVDQTTATGCTGCAVGRDELTGWGRLDVAAAIAALSQPLPSRDRFEANDDAGSRAYRIEGSNRRLFATVDFWDDQDDVYAIHLERGQRVYVGLTGRDPEQDLSLALWLPGTRSITGVATIRFRAKISSRGGPRQYFSFRAPRAGPHYVQVRITTPARSRYRLTIVKG